MNVTKRKKTPESDNEPMIKKRTTKSKSNGKRWNLLPVLCIVISACLFAYALLLFRSDDLIPFSEHRSAYFTSEQVDNRKWGTFRSGHYFGLKTLAKQSMVFGLLWFENRVIDNNVRIRHWCDQSDNLSKYGWLKHDLHSFGLQEILDNDLNLTTSFIVSNQSSWRARVAVDFNDRIKAQIRGQERKANSTRIRIGRELSLIPYLALDSLNDEQELVWISKDETNLGERTVFEFEGKTKVFRNGFKGRIIVQSRDLIYSNGLNRTIDPPLLQIKENILQNLFLTDYPGEESNKSKYLIILRENLKNKKNVKESRNNLALKQLIVKVPSVIDFEFEESDDHSQPNDYTTLLNERKQKFDFEFEEKFKLKEKGYSNEHVQFAKAALSNVLGSVGAFNGYSLVSLVEDHKLIKKEQRKIYKYGPLNLLTSVPSRSFFPRGFLWDEGFHQLLISKYDRNLSKIILSSWFDLMNRNGWIPREVVLGVEAEERVPNEFIVQNVHVANPPTFFLLVDSILHNLDQTELEKDYFNKLYDKLVVWYDWFNRTQIGHRPGSYRWRGRDPTIKTELNIKTLSSGLDDYPRASRPTDEELHLDLLSWMMFATRTMERLSNYLGHSSHQRFNQYSNWLTNEHLDKLHWSEEYQTYCDLGLHSKKVILKQIRTSNNQLVRQRKELEPARYGCVNEFGYVSLFPLILQLIEPTNPRLGVVLSKLRDPGLLWSEYGLRSLSKNSSYYNARNTEHDPPYWRSAIWINMNYLTLRSLNYYSSLDGPYREQAKQIYNELKTNLINNVYDQYKNRNYFFENYDDQTGQGKGCYPFTGWTALIVLIMSDSYN